MKRNSRTRSMPSDPAVHAAIRLGCFFLLLLGGILLCTHEDHLLLSRHSYWLGSNAAKNSSSDPAWGLIVGSMLAFTASGLAIVGSQLNRLWRARDE